MVKHFYSNEKHLIKLHSKVKPIIIYYSDKKMAPEFQIIEKDQFKDMYLYSLLLTVNVVLRTSFSLEIC